MDQIQFGLLQLCRVETAREHDAVYGTPNSHFTHAQDVEKEKNNNLNNSQRNTCITIGTTNFGKERRINLNVLTHNIVIFTRCKYHNARG